jgi:microsomal epoxide hydrolase
MTNTLISPFKLHIPETDLLDLRERLARTRFPDKETVGDTSQGVQLATMHALCEHWRTAYDWRATELALNRIGQFTTEIDGLPIHFLHAWSPHPDALPLVLCHGWPGSVLEFRKLIEPLTHPPVREGEAAQAFHVIAPSMPGFGFSGKPTATGWGLPRIADAWIELVRRLGYAERWALQGGDLGAGVCDAIARKQPSGLIGMHLNFAMFMTTPAEAAEATDAEKQMLKDAGHFWDQLSGYAKVQSTRPQTIGYSLADSPAGLAAWIYAMFQDTGGTPGDAESSFTKDEILDHVMMYWLNNSGASAARLYWELSQAGGPAGGQPAGAIAVPTGFTMLPKEHVRKSRRWVEKRYSRVVYFNEGTAGGHFAAMEQPQLLADDIRHTFASLRDGQPV